MKKEILPCHIKGNLIERLSKEWMLISAQKDGKTNTMTASWGGFGELWGKDVSYIVVRPSRYTYEFLENGEYFSLCFFAPDHKDKLAFCGKVSGRNCDKIKECSFTEKSDLAPYFEEAQTVIICKKLYSTMIKKDDFVSPDFADKMYPDGDYHKLYIGEIIKVLE